MGPSSDRWPTTWGRTGIEAWQAWRSSGITIPVNPLVTARLGRDLFVHGVSPAIGWAAGAARHPDSIAIVDADRSLTQQAAEDLTRGATRHLRDLGLAPGRTAALLGRNSIGFAVAIAAVARTGADLVYLNPGFSAEQVAAVCAEREVSLLLADPELAPRVPGTVPVLDLSRPGGWASPAGFRLSPGGGRHIILTSGTTGRPKGADRSRTPLEAAVSLLASLPYRELGTHIMAAPLFHSWGWLNHRLAALLDATEVMIPRPDAGAVLDAAERRRANLIVTTPVVIGRLMEAGPGDRDLSHLNGVLVSGSAIPPDIVARFAERFGPVLYNLDGSTEVGYATVATPTDLAHAPNSAGRPLPGVRVELRDSHGTAVPTGETGEVWVGSAAAFDGYVDGADKERDDGLVATGDVGVFDETGLLSIRGRSDDL
ncbi:MAG: AMP-binding protein, partial [Candidatus Nanopelagicales bacterium]